MSLPAAACELRGAPIPADTGYRAGVYAVAFSPVGSLVASADGDGTVRLWSRATHLSVGTIRLWPVSLFTHPYTTLCTDVGPPTRHDWNQYATAEPQPKICA